ncbi:MAG: hypothetical protein IT204_10190 [Fimbriimonadaceae bacterium]|nr:hypothetical protein [Fimbriimonadaceae bacterium]
MSDAMRQRYPHWIWPRADSHIVLSAPRSPDVFKVFVEPGGSFSPGVATFGVSVWLWLPAERRLVAPELLPREALRDRLLGGILPLHRSRWRAGLLEVDLRLGVEACPDEYHPAATLLARLYHRGRQPVQATVLLVLRSCGPAGGSIRALAYEPEIGGFLVNDQPLLFGARPAAEAGCVSVDRDGLDIGEQLRRGEFHHQARASDAKGWCSGYLAYPLTLEPGGEWEMAWDCPVAPSGAQPAAEFTALRELPAARRLEALADRWRAELEQVRLHCPDARVAEAFHGSLTHLLMAVVGAQPRIATLCYPLLWLRDTVYIINALDKAGLTDWSRPALDGLLERIFAGGFGPEADAPGEVLWLLEQHVRLTGDLAWAARAWPWVVARVAWIQRLRRATGPVREPASDLLPRARLHPEADLVAEAAVDGLINGRMDWHRPLFFVNAFALAGLRGATWLAAQLGHHEEAAAWAAEAAELATALRGARFELGRNERDTAAAIWPTGACDPGDPTVREVFERWWHQHRWDNRGVYRGEPRWRYFELGQAHNLLRLGMRERTLLTLEQFLRTQDAPGLYAWAEGDLTGDPTGDWRLVRGWWPTSKILPHGWSCAELALLVRDLFLYEEGEALVIGAGLRPEWLLHPDGVGISAAPTAWGRVSWELALLAPGQAQLSIDCAAPPPGGFRLRLPLPASAVVELDGAGIREVDGDWPLPALPGPVVVTVSLL